MHAEQTHRPEVVVLVEGPDGTRFEKRYAHDVAQAIVSLFNANARESGIGANARVIDRSPLSR